MVRPRQRERHCTFDPAAAVVANDVVYTGALDGSLLRVIETNLPLQTSNGVAGHGGAIDVGGALPSGDQLFVLSGYGMFGQMPGNLLLVYGLPSRP